MRGITVTLYEQVQSGSDPFGAPVYTETATPVDNVLVGQPTTDDVTSSVSMYGRKIEFMLGIPKGDTHDWENKKVSWTDAYGVHTVQTFGIPITGIEANIPTPWHMKVRCAAYE